jgi:hypothetical protein
MLDLIGGSAKPLSIGSIPIAASNPFNRFLVPLLLQKPALCLEL